MSSLFRSRQIRSPEDAERLELLDRSMADTPPKTAGPETATASLGAAASTPASTATTPVPPPKRNSLEAFLTWLASHWWFEVVVFIFAFSVIVLRTNDIQTRFSSLIPARFVVAVFWLCVAAWVISFTARKRAESKISASNREEARKLGTAVGDVQGSAGELKARMEGLDKTAGTLDGKLADASKGIDKILNAVETLPHASFRQAWMEQAFVMGRLATSSAIRVQDIEIEELADFIRTMLTAIASLAESYDIGSDARYAANVMFYIPKRRVEPCIEEGIWTDVRFRPKWCKEDPDLVDGVLILRKELSSLASDTCVDEAADDIGFIISADLPAQKWIVLPGGPRALVRGLKEQKYAVDGYDDLTTIDRLNSKDSNIEKDVIEEVKNYYKDRKVRSFLALTLPRLQTGLGNPLGVVSIHSDKPNILGGGPERYEVFAQLAAPFISEIAWGSEIWAKQKGLRLEA